MNIILMTILLTLLGTGLVALLVWLSVVSCRLIKRQEKQKIQLDNLEQNLEQITNNLYAYIDEKFKDLNTELVERNRELDKYIDEKFKDLNTELVERNRELDKYKDDVSYQFNECWKNLQNITKNVDSRIDKIYNSQFAKSPEPGFEDKITDKKKKKK